MCFLSLLTCSGTFQKRGDSKTKKELEIGFSLIKNNEERGLLANGRGEKNRFLRSVKGRRRKPLSAKQFLQRAAAE